MRLNLEHRIDAPLSDVEAASLAEDFQLRLTSLPNVHERRVLTQSTNPDGTIHRVVRYRFGGSLPAPVLRAIGGAAVSWDEEGTFDPDAHEWRFVIHPHVMPGRLDCAGRYRFVPASDETVRIVEIELVVRVPIVGRRVAKYIAEGLRDTMDAEARMLASYLRERREPIS
jgi:hypothetical protein